MAVKTAAAISLSSDIGKSDLEKDTDKTWEIYPKIAQFCEKFRKKYREITCRNVQMELYGMSFDLHNDKAHEKFEEIAECEKVVKDAAGWATEIIIEKSDEDYS
ncbi:hypothetical protein AKJ65_03335 [candidate division MSBL1 archaeon SCGC-AAA259E19]|uniref:Uncharacterized protein n=1 Tax=candidate division MSBL1 archaeon SCGC-AAA259E19 TaxID=1698264 RepID=A0A133UKY0_9EURY|nr:hypothetical protein AKJ65_03335 [candidate division MSBL1 archaeon SCGC-AAA259E19]